MNNGDSKDAGPDVDDEHRGNVEGEVEGTAVYQTCVPSKKFDGGHLIRRKSISFRLLFPLILGP